MLKFPSFSPSMSVMVFSVCLFTLVFQSLNFSFISSSFMSSVTLFQVPLLLISTIILCLVSFKSVFQFILEQNMIAFIFTVCKNVICFSFSFSS